MRSHRKVLGRWPGTVLIEYRDAGILRRCYLPEGVPMNPRKGIPVGIHKSSLRKLLNGELANIASRLENALHERGLFTGTDAETAPESGRLVQAALCESMRPLAPHVLDLIRAEEV